MSYDLAVYAPRGCTRVELSALATGLPDLHISGEADSQSGEHYFGPPRTSGGSHAVFQTPWPGDPRVNIQNDHGAAKAYQVRQILAAIDKKEGAT